MVEEQHLAQALLHRRGAGGQVGRQQATRGLLVPQRASVVWDPCEQALQATAGQAEWMGGAGSWRTWMKGQSSGTDFVASGGSWRAVRRVACVTACCRPERTLASADWLLPMAARLQVVQGGGRRSTQGLGRPPPTAPTGLEPPCTPALPRSLFPAGGEPPVWLRGKQGERAKASWQNGQLLVPRTHLLLPSNQTPV